MRGNQSGSIWLIAVQQRSVPCVKETKKMQTWMMPAAGAVFLLGAVLLLPRMPIADSTAEAANASAPAPKGYRTCFVEQHFVATGAPRLEARRRCVFDD